MTKIQENALLVIAPYWFEGTWVFDDPAVGLKREPFVLGVPEMIDRLVKQIPNASTGFRLIFSKAPFPGYQLKLVWVREETGGNWYRTMDQPKEGWLCPALLKYFPCAPGSIYVRAESKERHDAS
ncbi:MAG: hypothetical protein O7F16_09655 [Acidobacteria bacterium]|nr:hypothetical protein [Acidobacteriota bacterium]